MNSKKCCVYCRTEISDARAMDVCDRCGISVWGEKMFRTIIDSTNKEKEKGNLELGQVSENQ